MKDLATSSIDRQNILNNRYAVERIQQEIGIEGYLFQGEYVYTKRQVADFYQVDISTIDRYLATFTKELRDNGYVLCKGNLLREFKLEFAHLANEVSKTTQLGLFSFRALLNIGMLLSESERAKQLRSVLLDIVIATISERAGGVKYINRRDRGYLQAAIVEENYRRNLTTSVNQCVEGHPTYKYAQITDAIYIVVFGENAREYRELLKLKEKDNVRRTLYAEVLLVISSFENGLASRIRALYEAREGKALSVAEVQRLIEELAADPLMVPYLTDARTKMASRDYSLRDVYHTSISDYLRAVAPEEFERFIGSESVDFDEILEENKDVLNRLK